MLRRGESGGAGEVGLCTVNDGGRGSLRAGVRELGREVLRRLAIDDLDVRERGRAGSDEVGGADDAAEVPKEARGGRGKVVAMVAESKPLRAVE